VIEQAPHNPKQQTEPNNAHPQIGTESAPFIVETHPRPKNEREAAEAKADKKRVAYINWGMLGLTGAVAVFTGLLVYVGWRGVRAALRTLRAVEKQAELQSRSIDLQERALQQWVDIGNWQTTPINISRDQYGKETLVEELIVQTEIVNPTNFPLALPNAEIDLILGDATRAAFRFEDNCRLTPNSPQAVRITIMITEAESKQFLERELRIRIKGDLAHIGVLGKVQPQPICGTLMCRHLRKAQFDAETPQDN
jgi:LEA14-like dessication related protein